MKRLTTLALLAGMLSAPALHSEDTPPDALPPLNFPLPDAEASGASGACQRSKFARHDRARAGKRPSAGFATRDAVAGCIWGR